MKQIRHLSSLLKLYVPCRVQRGAQLQVLATTANLGWLGGSWALEALNLFAEDLEIAQDFRIEFMGWVCASLDTPPGLKCFCYVSRSYVYDM